MSRRIAWAVLLVVAACSKGGGDKPTKRARPTLEISHGVGVGEVTATSAVIWARANRAGTLIVGVSGPGTIANRKTVLRAGHDFAGTLRFDGLVAATNYTFRAAVVDEHGNKSQKVGGSFRTAAAADVAARVTFAWSGDLAGQNVCRDAKRGFPIFEVLDRRRLDFFVALGDMIYADNGCEPKGLYGNVQVAGERKPAAALPAFWARWKYNRADPKYQMFLARTPIYALWDDHEVQNDFGPKRDSGLMPAGLQAFYDYNPLPRTGGKMYRKLRRGKHLELFLLDNRQYRDANDAPDSAAKPKTMLGAAQRAWLIRELRASTATWKVIVSSVPISIPTGTNAKVAGRDGWADLGTNTGYEHELRAIFEAGANSKTLWITTDVHFAAAFRYTPFADRPHVHVYEAVVGPLNAGLYPNAAFDKTFGTERLLFYGPADPSKLTWAEAMRYMTFGEIDIDASGQLHLRVINGDGKTVFERSL